MDRSHYEYSIVGAGIAGLHCALRIAKARPRARIAVIEAYSKVGGRMDTFHGFYEHNGSSHAVQWESGAGRVHSSHTLVLNYVKQYKLTLLPIPSNTVWRSSEDSMESKDLWPSLSTLLTTTLPTLRPAVLATHTIYQLLTQLYGAKEAERICKYFPYYAELYVMRADLALKSIQHELGMNSNFFVLKEGWGALAECMKEDLVKRGVSFLLDHRLVGLSSEGTKGVTLKFQLGPGQHGPLTTIHGDKVILTIPSSALKHVHPFHNLPALRHITMCPLLRTYAVFPTAYKEAWFSRIPKTVTDSPIRYFIPVSKSTAMVSYTDASNTTKWSTILKKKGEKALCSSIVKELQSLFPEKRIPPPLFFKAHYWKQGCSYWTPGTYSPEEKSIQLMNPLSSRWPDLFLCGESYSLRQAWMEGALEHAEQLLVRHNASIL
jgi:monoamine oxidase